MLASKQDIKQKQSTKQPKNSITMDDPMPPPPPPAYADPPSPAPFSDEEYESSSQPGGDDDDEEVSQETEDRDEGEGLPTSNLSTWLLILLTHFYSSWNFICRRRRKPR